MTTYKNIKGSRIKVVSSDPSPVAVGDTWFNSGSNVLKVRAATGTWSEVGDLNTAKFGSGGCGETAEAAMVWSGSPSPYTTNNEVWNGSSWTESGDVNTARFACASGIGTTSAALFGGGGTGPTPNGVALSEEWNGSAWAEGNNMNTGRVLHAGFGTQTAGVLAGGWNSCINYPSDLGYTEEYNGSSWSEGADLNTVRRALASAIISTDSAGMVFGGTGFIGGNKDETETWNGSAWSETADLNTARNGSKGLGTSSAAVCAGGHPSYTAVSEEWNGTAWSTVNSMNTGRNEASSGGSSSAGLVASGQTASSTAGAITEEFAPVASTKTVTAS